MKRLFVTLALIGSIIVPAPRSASGFDLSLAIDCLDIFFDVYKLTEHDDISERVSAKISDTLQLQLELGLAPLASMRNEMRKAALERRKLRIELKKIYAKMDQMEVKLISKHEITHQLLREMIQKSEKQHKEVKKLLVDLFTNQTAVKFKFAVTRLQNKLMQENMKGTETERENLRELSQIRDELILVRLELESQSKLKGLISLEQLAVINLSLAICYFYLSKPEKAMQELASLIQTPSRRLGLLKIKNELSLKLIRLRSTRVNGSLELKQSEAQFARHKALHKRLSKMIKHLNEEETRINRLKSEAHKVIGQSPEYQKVWHYLYQESGKISSYNSQFIALRTFEQMNKEYLAQYSKQLKVRKAEVSIRSVVQSVPAPTTQKSLREREHPTDRINQKRRKPIAQRSRKRALLIRGVVIHQRKSNGTHWDAGLGSVKAPDPYVKIYINGNKVKQSQVQKNTHYLTLNELFHNLRVGTRIKVEVIDKDLSLDDPIGVVKFRVGKPGTRSYSSRGIRNLSVVSHRTY